MYEMEGPRLCPGALASRLLRGRTPRSYHQCQILAVSTGRPALPASPPVSLGLEPVFCGEEFLLATAPAAQGLSAISSRFFCRPQDICRLSPVHSSFPLAYAQVCPQSVWTDRPGGHMSSALRAERSEYRQPAQKRGRGCPARLEPQSPANRRTDDVARLTAGTQRGPGRGQGPQPGQDPNRDRSRGADQRAGSRRGGLYPARIDTYGDRVCPELVVKGPCLRPLELVRLRQRPQEHVRAVC
jgi:hypothetical protein